MRSIYFYHTNFIIWNPDLFFRLLFCLF